MSRHTIWDGLPSSVERLDTSPPLIVIFSMLIVSPEASMLKTRDSVGEADVPTLGTLTVTLDEELPVNVIELFISIYVPTVVVPSENVFVLPEVLPAKESL